MIQSGLGSGPAVLLVDDDRGVLESQADLLRKECRVIATSDVDEAVALLGSDDLALVLTDQRMPQMTGTELLARAASVSPSTVRILCTAYSDIEAVIEAINKGHVFYYFAKPWDPVLLIETVRGALEMHRLLVARRRLLTDLSRVAEGEAMPSPPAPPASNPIERLRLDNDLLTRSLAQVEQTFLHLQRIHDAVPTCLKCGRIKTGDGRWEAVLEYLKKHSTYLSHGYCPDCMELVRTEWRLERSDGASRPAPKEDR